MSEQQIRLREDVRFRILHLLRDTPELSQRQLAAALGVSLVSAHYLLKALIAKGFVTLGNFPAARDRRRYAYLLTPRGLAEKGRMTRQFLARKLEDYAVLQEEIARLRADLPGASRGASQLGLQIGPQIGRVGGAMPDDGAPALPGGAG